MFDTLRKARVTYPLTLAVLENDLARFQGILEANLPSLQGAGVFKEHMLQTLCLGKLHKSGTNMMTIKKRSNVSLQADLASE